MQKRRLSGRESFSPFWGAVVGADHRNRFSPARNLPIKEKQLSHIAGNGRRSGSKIGSGNRRQQFARTRFSGEYPFGDRKRRHLQGILGKDFF